MSSTDYSMKKEITDIELNNVGLIPLLNMGLDPNCKVRYAFFEPLIFYFLRKGDFASVELLIMRGADLRVLGIINSNLFHVLLSSSPNSWNSDIINLLMRNKVDLNLLDGFNCTPLFCFLYNFRAKDASFIAKHLPLWRTLIVDGVDVTILGVDRGVKKTVITLAENILDELRQQNTFVGEDGRKAETEFKDLISHMQKMAKIKEEEALKRRGAGRGDAKVLVEAEAVRQVNPELELLLQGKTDIKKLDSRRRNLLHIKLIHMALFSSDEKNARHYYCKQHEDCPKIVDEYLKRGVDVNAVDKLGETPLISFLTNLLERDRATIVSLLSNTFKPLVMKLIDAGLDLTGLVDYPGTGSLDLISLTNVGVVEKFLSELRDKKVFEGEDGKKAEEQVVSLIEYMKAKTTEKLEQKSRSKP